VRLYIASTSTSLCLYRSTSAAADIPPTTFIGILSPPSPALGGLRETRSMPVYVRGDDDEFASQSIVGRVCVKHDGIIDTRREAVQNVVPHRLQPVHVRSVAECTWTPSRLAASSPHFPPKSDLLPGSSSSSSSSARYDVVVEQRTPCRKYRDLYADSAASAEMRTVLIGERAAHVVNVRNRRTTIDV